MDVDRAGPVIERVMEAAVEPAVALSVPLVVDAKAAGNWDETHWLREHYALNARWPLRLMDSKEAPEYNPEIAAMVFEELAFDPADKVSRQSHSERQMRRRGVELLRLRFHRQRRHLRCRHRSSVETYYGDTAAR